jgi:hypothetical protein
MRQYGTGRIGAIGRTRRSAKAPSSASHCLISDTVMPGFRQKRKATDLIGVAGGDYLGQVRRRNAIRMAHRTDEIISARHIQETVAISPSLAIPLLSAAGDESRPELQDLWARLLANAMDPARANNLRIEFIEAVKRFH